MTSHIQVWTLFDSSFLSTPKDKYGEDFTYEFTPNLIFLQIQYICLFLRSDEAVMQFTLSDYNQRQDYMDAIDNIQYKAGGTNTAAALNMIRNQGKLTTLSQKKSKYLWLYYDFVPKSCTSRQ